MTCITLITPCTDNRIDNDLKLISVNQDYKRNIKVCKKLKDKYDLTYGKGKEKVKREKLDNPNKVKYYIQCHKVRFTYL